MTRRVVILGGGPGGLVAANTLAKLSVPGVEIVLVDRSAVQLFQPGLVSVLFSEAEPSDFERPLAELAHPTVDAIVGEVTSIDPTARQVGGSFGQMGYDQLVVALGAATQTSTEAAEPGLAPWTVAGALRGRQALAACSTETKIVVGATTPVYRCPPAVFDLAVRVKAYRGAPVEVFHPWPTPLAPFGERISSQFTSMLQTAGIRYHGDFHPSAIGEGSVTSSEGERLSYDLAFVVPAHRPPLAVASSALAGDGGWPEVSYPTLTHPAFPEISIVGDAAAPSLGIGMAGTLAASEGRYVAQRIGALLRGTPEPGTPDMAALCFVDTGSTGSALVCDFTGPASATGPASCVLLPFLPYYRKAKRLFAEEWFSTTMH